MEETNRRLVILLVQLGVDQALMASLLGYDIEEDGLAHTENAENIEDELDLDYIEETKYEESHSRSELDGL